MGPPMLLQIATQREFPTTHVTNKRLLTGVGPLVNHQLTAGAELQTAGGTAIRFFARMDSFVFRKARTLDETFVTQVTEKRFHRGMGAVVVEEGEELSESFPAQITFKGFFVGMDSDVFLKVAVNRETFMADVARIRFFARMGPLVVL